METITGSRKGAVAVVAVLFFSCAYSSMAATCVDVVTSLQPCVPALNGAAPTPSLQCCGGLQQVANYEADLGVSSTCNCTKSMLLNVPGLVISINIDTNIQNMCKVSLGFSLSSTIAC